MMSFFKKFFLMVAIFFALNTYGLILAPLAVNAATLSLSPASGTKAVGDTFNVDIVLDTTGEAVSGATAILTYDTLRLQVIGSQLTQGPIFSQVLTNTVDPTTGQIRYDSGSLTTPYTGRGVMATIQFKTLTAGTAQVNYVFDTSSTINTSLVAATSGPTNLLTAVFNGVFTIGSGGSTTPSLPPAGIWEDTLVLVFGGGLLLGVGWLLRHLALVL